MLLVLAPALRFPTLWPELQRLAVLRREVILGSGKADLIAIEPSGRLAIIEIKLAHNAEARRAVAAQILAYAAFLRGWAGLGEARDYHGTADRLTLLPGSPARTPGW